MMIEVIKISNKRDLQEAMQVRKKVFVEEQNVPEALECDEHDKTANHFLALINGVPCGTARWRMTAEGVKLERFAVLKDYRGNGIGSSLVKAVLQDIKASESGGNVYLHSQIDAVFLYEKFGFVKDGPEFEEAGIRHYKMLLPSL